MWVLNSRNKPPGNQLGAWIPSFWTSGAGGKEWEDHRALGAASAAAVAAGGGGSVLSGTIISPVGSLIIGIICSPGFFSDKLIPCQGKAV